MQEIHKLQAKLTDLFPPQAASYISQQLPTGARLLEAELTGTDTMRANRKLEFTHGRHCARSALDLLGLPQHPIPRGKDREPVWPHNITGSISHTGNVAAAVVANKTLIDSLGLDIEFADPLEENLIQLICRPDEQVNGDPAKAKLLFSIKESIYKCLFPTAREFLDFQQVRVQISEGGQNFRAHCDSPHYGEALLARLQGRYCIADGIIASGCWLNGQDK